MSTFFANTFSKVRLSRMNHKYSGVAAMGSFVQHSITHAIMITGFVFIMMVLIEYLNVLSRGIWQKGLRGGLWKQYLLASFLGATPGCLGAFTAVSLYTHREITLGALVAAMTATSGDESFLMLSMIPEKAPMIFILLLCIGLAAGYLTDALFKKKQEKKVDKKDYFRVECSYGSFCRSFRLPENVNGDEANASFKDGELEIRIPKSGKEKKKKITIS